mgnify:CR=1 FL=1
MKKIVRGNDFTLRIPVCKIVNGEQVAFPLPACTDIVVNIVNQYRRVNLAYSIDTAEDNIINARVEGDAVSVGTYALEVRGKIFGNDWRSKEYEQFAIVDNNASGDTAFNGELIEGEDSVEMNTALVILPPTAELTQLINDANTALETAKQTDATLKANESERIAAEQQRASAEAQRVSAENKRSESEEVRHAAENERVSNEEARKTAESQRVEAENERVSNEDARTANETARVAAEKQRATTFTELSANVDAAVSKANTAASAANTATDKANAEEGKRAEAENLRTEAEATRKQNENARLEAETERVRQEAAREAAESARQTAEAERAGNESARKVSESDRVAAEQQRVTAEENRNLQEDARHAAELERANGETARQTAESEREADEQERKANETERKTAETQRKKAEETRIAAEASRVSAEEQRETTLATTKANCEAATKKASDAASEATIATSKADASAEKANAAAVAAENVDATLANDVLTVTNRNGESTSLQLASYAEVGDVVSEVKHLSETIGAYTDRPDIVLTPSEQNVAISADGVKVAKIGWAIAEFTAEKGNEYLFKPNAVDGTVCIFAEKISSVETRSIDYTYSYNEDGMTASATATYLGKTHTYSYAYADGEDGTKSVTITDESGAVVTELPYQYKTTVGSYAPLVRLNADAELPKDGYCRYMSHFKGNSAIKVVVSYKVNVADLTMKVLRDGVFASISTQLGNLSQKENETRSLAVELKEKMATFVDTNPYVGMVRMNGDASPDAEMTFGDKALMHEVGAEWKLATVKNGVVTHVMAPGRLTLDENGEEVKIDGTDGDVMLINRNANVINATKVIDGREMNCLAIGKTAAKWYGVESKKMPAFGMTPCETVNAKIEGDARSQAHCIYNTAVNGMYGTADTSVLKASYINKGAGHCASVNGVLSIQYAQNKNTDPLTARPYMGWHHGTYEALLTMMFAEIGTVDHTDVKLFGTGLCATSFNENLYNDEAISAVSGWKIIAATGETYYSTYTNQFVYVVSKDKIIRLASGLSTVLYNPVQLLEGQRVLDAIAKAGLVDKIGNKANIFYYDENGNAVCASNGSVNLDTGEGMEVLKFYYVVRNVPRCEGMKDGVMTAVVNRYVKAELADGCQSTDKKVSFDGAIAILKASIPVYRGFTLPYIGQFRQISYAYYTIHNIDGVTHVDFRCTESMKDVRPLTVFNQNAYQCAYGTTPPMLVGLNKKKDYGVTDMRENYVKTSDYSISLFCYKTVGASLHTHECAYLWLYPSNVGGVNISQVRGCTIGCVANNRNVSTRTAMCQSGPLESSTYFAGAFAVLLNQ